MRDAHARIRDVNDGIIAVTAAKRDLRQHTGELVAKMKEDGHDRAWGVAYMQDVCKFLTSETTQWAMHYFNEAWPEEAGDERPAPDAPAGA